MDAQERLEFIRKKLGIHAPATAAKPLGIHRSAHPEPVVRRKLAPRNPEPAKCWSYSVYGEFNTRIPREREWVSKPDQAPSDELRHKRTAKPHHLTKIAEKWATLKRR